MTTSNTAARGACGEAVLLGVIERGCDTVMVSPLGQVRRSPKAALSALSVWAAVWLAVGLVVLRSADNCVPPAVPHPASSAARHPATTSLTIRTCRSCLEAVDQPLHLGG